MTALEIVVTRRATPGAPFCLGRMTVAGRHYGFTCEDEDRKMEAGGVKVPKQTAIPRGRYQVTVTFSNRFQKLLPLLDDVPGFTAIRIHGGNTQQDTEGCILLGKILHPQDNPTGVAICAERVSALTQMIIDAEEQGQPCWITVE